MFSSFVEENKKTWAHDRKQTVGASEIFKCIREVWFGKRGAEFGYSIDEDVDGERWGATKRGDLLEEHFVAPTIKDHTQDGIFILSGKQQKTFFHNYNSATPDGLIIDLDKDALEEYGIKDIESDCICVEIKTIDPRVRLHSEKNIHHGQAQTQMGIIRELTKYRPMYCVVLYVDASFLDKIRIFPVRFEEEAWVQAQERAATVFEIDDPAELLAEGKIDGTCEYCDWQHSCALVQTGLVPENDKLKLDDGQIDDLDTLIKEYDRLRKLFKESERAFKQAGSDIKDKLVEFDVRKVPGKKYGMPWSVSWGKQKGRKSLDQSLVKNALGLDTLEDFQKEGDPFEVLRVTTPEDNE